MENDKKVSCTAIAILYVLLSYASPFIGVGLAMKTTPQIMFSPVAIMLFVGPAVIAMLSVYGYLTMLGGNAFSLAYIKKAKEEEIHGVFPSTMGNIFQFFFVADVISLVILSLKEKKYIGATVTVIIILILGFIATSSWLIVNLVALFR